jgi:DNA polymerase III subunit gamma/tau
VAPAAPKSEPPAKPAAPAPAPEAVAPKAAALALAQLEPAGWIDLFHQLPLTGVARNIAANSVLQEVGGNRLVFVLEEGKATLYNDEHRKRIESVLTDYFAVPLQVRVDIGAVSMETPAAWRTRREAERKEAARKAFVEDELVRAVVERFGAEIQYDSITSTTPDTLH